MFVHAALSHVGQSTFHWMPFSQGLVRVGGEPALVPDNVINALHRRVEEIWDAGGIAFDGLKQGDKVFIHSGVFEGYRAIFDIRLAGSERVRVLLEMLNRRYVPMEVDVGMLERIEGS
jgi:transcription antitermination factor NusG